MRKDADNRAVFGGCRTACITHLFGLCLVLLVSVPLHAQQQLPLDRKAVFVTHVPHRNSIVNRGSSYPQPSTALGGVLVPFSSSPYIVGPTVTPTTTLPEGEEEIALSPLDSKTMIAAISDFALNGGFNTTKYSFSRDNGSSWTESYIPLDPTFGLPATGDGFLWFANSDPVVAIDKAGHAYLSDLYLDAIDNGNGLYVSAATVNSGFNFTIASTLPVKTNPSGSTTQLEDKPWITVDNSSSSTAGNVYATWSHFSNINTGTDFIAFSRSTNHAVTWASPKRISPRLQDGAVQGSAFAVGPHGEIYVCYEVFFAGNKRQQFLAKSTNGGLTFSAPTAKTPMFNDLAFTSSYRKNSFAALAVNPTNGNVYMLYADQPGANAQVEFLVSKNGGVSFSAPKVINDNSTGQRLMPALAVDSGGALHASWFDTRNSPSNSEFYDIYATFSRDGGTTFAPNARVTASTVDAGTASFIGDYAGIAAGGGFAHPVWTNGGFNNGQLQTAVLQLP